MSHGPDYHRFQEYVDPVVDNLETVERRGHSRFDVFDDWLDLMLYSLQGRDDPYLDIIDEYDDGNEEPERNADLFAQSFGHLHLSAEKTGADVLGVVYEELGMDSDAFGQYFTPHNVAEVKAEMVLHDLDPEDFSDRSVRIADPAGGSGRLLVAAEYQLPDGLDAWYMSVDKDPACAKMGALNQWLHGLEGISVHGDSLTLEKYRAWETVDTGMGPMLHEVDVDELPPLAHEQAENQDSGSEAADVNVNVGVEESEQGELSDFGGGVDK